MGDILAYDHPHVADLDIFCCAKVLINRHGGSAAYYAARRADDMLDRGHVKGAAVRGQLIVRVLPRRISRRALCGEDGGKTTI